jgi:transcriptional regulator with GAF, ATPase, and Fis domain
VFPIEVPPLRKRREDIIPLAQHLLTEACNDFGRKPLKLTRSQAEEILAYDWPGNVREMKNVIERAVILSKGEVLRLDLSLPRGGEPSAEPPVAADAGNEILTDNQLQALQKRNLVAALKQADWRVSGAGGAAEILGVKPTTLADRMRKFGVRKPRAA